MPEVMSLHVCLPACRCPRYHQRACRCPRYHQHACRPPGLLTPAMYLILSTSLTVCFSLNQFSFFSSFFFLACLSFLCPFFLLCPLPFFSFSFFLSPLLTCMQNSLAACKRRLRAWALCRTLSWSESPGTVEVDLISEVFVVKYRSKVFSKRVG